MSDRPKLFITSPLHIPNKSPLGSPFVLLHHPPLLYSIYQLLSIDFCTQHSPTVC